MVGHVHVGIVARVLDGLRHHGRARPLRHIADEPRADRHLGTDQPLTRPADGQAAGQDVVLGDPERAALRPQCGEDRLEDLREQRVEVER